MIAVATATLLGFVMISSSALQAQTAETMRQITAAEYLAESGGQLALYYLQYPAASPVAVPDGYYPGQSGITFGGGVPGSADVSVVFDAATQIYTITSVGRTLSGGAGNSIARRLTVKAVVVRHFRQTAALTAGGDVMLCAGCTIVGPIDVGGNLDTVAGAVVTGLARLNSKSGGGAVANFQYLGVGEAVTVPSMASIRDYTGTYTYNGQTYAAQKLSSGVIANRTLPSAADALVNPLGIFWTDSNVALSGNATINGTLVVTNGSVNVHGIGPNVITPMPGMPAMVVERDVNVAGIGCVLTVNGLAYIGGGMKTGALMSRTTINGSLLAAGDEPVDEGYKGKLTINYDASKVNLPDFSTANAVTVGVRVLSWEMQ